jgi:hypothetical protein
LKEIYHLKIRFHWGEGDNIEMDSSGTEEEDVHWICFAQDRENWPTVIKT